MPETSQNTSSARAARLALNRLMAQNDTAALEAQLAAGAFAPFGLRASRVTGRPGLLAPLAALPADPLARWWALCRLTDTTPQAVCTGFALGDSFCSRLLALDDLWQQGVPADLRALKLQLAWGAPLPYPRCIETFAALDSRWQAVPALYEALLACGEPYLPQHLAIGPASLLAIGIPPHRLEHTQWELLRLVIDTPTLNTTPLLTQLAQGYRSVKG